MLINYNGLKLDINVSEDLGYDNIHISFGDNVANRSFTIFNGNIYFIYNLETHNIACTFDKNMELFLKNLIEEVMNINVDHYLIDYSIKDRLMIYLKDYNMMKRNEKIDKIL